MPKSKRKTKVHLNSVQKVKKKNKKIYINKIHQQLKNYSGYYLLSFTNRRNQLYEEVKSSWEGSKFITLLNSIAKIAFGKDSTTEPKKNFHKFASYLKGENVLFLTNSPKKEVLKYFKELEIKDYARAGSIATKDIKLQKGLLKNMEFSMEPRLKNLGLPIKLDNKKIYLLKDITLCNKNDVLSANTCNILKIFDYKISNFTCKIKCYWENGIIHEV